MAVHPFGFDPEQPGARRLAEGHRVRRDRVVVRLTRPVLWSDVGLRPAGEELELPRIEAAELVAAGVAELAG